MLDTMDSSEKKYPRQRLVDQVPNFYVMISSPEGGRLVMGCSKNYLQKSQLEPIMKWLIYAHVKPNRRAYKVAVASKIILVYTTYSVSIYI